jgi:hypothetical protein
MIKIALSFALLLVCFVVTFTQTEPEKSPTEDAEKLRKDAIVFLRETQTEVNGMRSLENRISFSSELAGLMWFNDEREARGMYAAVISDFRDLVAKYDSQMNALGITSADNSEGSGGFLSFGIEPTDKSRILKRFSTAMAVRQQITMSIAEHDPELAMGFYLDSLSAISNVEFRRQVEARDSFFETQLFGLIAENNPGKAAQFASKSLDKGFNYQHLELLKKIHKKDAEKGAEYGLAIVARLKTEKIDASDFYILGSLLDYGDGQLAESRKAGGKKPPFSVAQMRELAEILANAILTTPELDNSVGVAFLDKIQKYAPGRAAQIRAKFRRSSEVASFGNANLIANASNSSRRASSNANWSANEYGSSNSNFNSSDYGISTSNTELDAERKLMSDVQGLGQKNLPKEEREKFVTQARKIIMQAQGREKKIVGLSLLAAQVSKLGDKELASEIMRDAEAFVNPSPKTYQDFLLSWMLASGYAEADPDKAFPLLEETIGRANSTLEAFVKVGEFVDVAEEMIVDGEVQVGAFGGQMIRGLTSELSMADTTIRVLAKSDFGKMKNVTNRFDRPEIRVLAKMMVLRAVLSPTKGLTPEQVLPTDPFSEGGIEK